MSAQWERKEKITENSLEQKSVKALFTALGR
jgi:hypothetical protein